ncbi:MAG TPA: hypothetical protein PKC50_10660, partial [Elusimicrobiota bacterium]|nr:hypothetical protein [Elusimicrobiota bacterium]
MDHQTNGRLAWYLGWWEFLGKGYAYDAVYPGDISKITAAEVSQTAKDITSQPSVTVRIISKGPASSKPQ